MSYYWLAILTSVVWGIAPIFEKVGLAKVQPLTGLFYRSLGVFLGLILLTFFMVKPQEIRSADLKSVAFIMAGGFLASFVAQILFYHSLKIGDVSKVVPISGSYPLIAFILGVIILGESVTPVKIAGCLCVIFGIWLLK
ncbi:MAG: EamA family transporter [Candidatus Margulisiibacteriota bacterium]